MLPKGPVTLLAPCPWSVKYTASSRNVHGPLCAVNSPMNPAPRLSMTSLNHISMSASTPRTPTAPSGPAARNYSVTVPRIRFSGPDAMTETNADAGHGDDRLFREIRPLAKRLFRGQRAEPQAILGHKDTRTTAMDTDVRGAEWIEVKQRQRLFVCRSGICRSLQSSFPNALRTI